MLNFFPIAGLSTTFADSDITGKTIVMILIIGSMLAWTVMVVKFRQLSMAKKMNNKFMKAYRKETSPIGLFIRKTHFPESPCYEIYKYTCLAIGKSFNMDDDDLFMGGIANADKLTNIQLDGIKKVAECTMADQVIILEKMMVGVASAATTAPFLGLLGTVLGVMSAFGGMAESGSAMLSAVAPGIASALLTTVVGLLVALPSSLGYNFLTEKIRILSVEMDNFVQELSSDIELQFSPQE